MHLYSPLNLSILLLTSSPQLNPVKPGSNCAMPTQTAEAGPSVPLKLSLDGQSTSPQPHSHHHSSHLTSKTILPSVHIPEQRQPSQPLQSSSATNISPTHPPDTKVDAPVKPLSHKLLLALKSKPTLTRTWEKKSYAEEQRTAPLPNDARQHEGQMGEITM